MRGVVASGLRIAFNSKSRGDWRFFRDGWGDESVLKECSRASIISGAAQPVSFRWSKSLSTSPFALRRDGTYNSPYKPHLLPEESRLARVRLLLPSQGTPENTPLCICFPMTGDEGYAIRSRIFGPLLEKGIGLLLPQNPFYGARRPKSQANFFLPRVQDMLIMSTAAVEEGKALVAWAFEQGFSRVVLTGVSQGGMLAASVGAYSRAPVALALSLSAHSPCAVLTEGRLRKFVSWDSLGMSQEESFEKLRNIFSLGDITQMPTPILTHAVSILGARWDQVVPRNSVEKIHRAWPGSDLRWISGTHLSSIWLSSHSFRRNVRRALDRLEKVQ